MCHFCVTHYNFILLFFYLKCYFPAGVVQELAWVFSVRDWRSDYTTQGMLLLRYSNETLITFCLKVLHSEQFCPFLWFYFSKTSERQGHSCNQVVDCELWILTLTAQEDSCWLMNLNSSMVLWDAMIDCQYWYAYLTVNRLIILGWNCKVTVIESDKCL